MVRSREHMSDDYQDITKIPDTPLEKGFYYHYHHDSNGPINNYAYEVLGVSRHTETDTLTMLYRPLYENTYFDVDFSNRPLDMAMGVVMKDGKEMPRFRKIDDPEIILKLTEIRNQMYGS